MLYFLQLKATTDVILGVMAYETTTRPNGGHEPGDDNNNRNNHLSPEIIATQKYLNGMGRLYEALGKSSIRGDDLQLVVPESDRRANVSYIGGAVLVAGREVGDFDVYTLNDDGQVIHNTLDSPRPASPDEVDELFDIKLAGARLRGIDEF